MKVFANSNTIDTLQQWEKICNFNGEELRLYVNGEEVEDLFLNDDDCIVYFEDGKEIEVELDHDGKFDLEVERIISQNITNIMFHT
jgi:hypothetical protein